MQTSNSLPAFRYVEKYNPSENTWSKKKSESRKNKTKRRMMFHQKQHQIFVFLKTGSIGCFASSFLISEQFSHAVRHFGLKHGF